MNALLFPGQGSQLVGMGSEFYKEFEIVKNLFRLADEKLNLPISKIILDGPADQLQMTANTQPAILTVSFSIYKVLKEEFGFDISLFKFFAGHSLGEYSALVSADSLKFDDALYLLHERGKAMQEAVPVGQGSMAAVLGLNIMDLKNLLKEQKKGICEIANDNADGQVILSGEKDSVNYILDLLKEKKSKIYSSKSKCSISLFLNESCSKKMEAKINNTNFYNPKFEIISNVTANAEKDVDKIKNLLIEQIYSAVRWRKVSFVCQNKVSKILLKLDQEKHYQEW